MMGKFELEKYFVEIFDSHGIDRMFIVLWLIVEEQK
jgi:hypothetical protein